MAKAEQILILEPQYELHFRGPFTDVVTSYLKLSNPTDRRVMFKVKTTAPKRYCVRPNSGIIEAKQSVSVAVMLQPFDYDPTEKNKHKFMVQTMIVPDGEINQDLLWREASADALMDSKLRCVFEMPETSEISEHLQNNNLDTNTVQGEEKVIVSKVVPEPAVKSSPKASNVKLELKEAVEENKRLKEELNQLRQENAQLKDEGIRLRVARSNPAGGEPSARIFSPLQPQVTAREHLKPAESTDKLQKHPMLFLGVILVVGFMGIVLGKFVL